jgi:hypothetical protein
VLRDPGFVRWHAGGLDFMEEPPVVVCFPRWLCCHGLQVMALVTQICKEVSGAQARKKSARV